MKPVVDVKQDIKPVTVIAELSGSTVNLKVYFWADTFDYKKGVLQIESEVVTKVKDALETKPLREKTNEQL